MPQKSSGKYVWFQTAPASTPVFSIGDQTKNVGPIILGIAKKPELTLGGKYVLATESKTTFGDILKTWGRQQGKETEYIEISLEAYNRLWPMWGQEMGVMNEFWGEFGDKSWSGQELLTKEDLGITEKLVTSEEALASYDWSSVL
jgi:NmrA-like family